MLKKFKRLFLILSAPAFLFSAVASAQTCTPDPAIVALNIRGVFPTDSMGIDTGIVNEVYSQTFTIIIPADTFMFGFLAEIDSAHIDSMAGLPAGDLHLEFGNADSMYVADVPGCFTLTGTITDTAGLYFITLYLTAYGMVYGTPGGDIHIEDVGSYPWSPYNFHVKSCAGIPIPVVTNTNNDLDCGLPGYDYQWYFNNSVIPGADEQTYHATLDGDYTVVITDSTGCSAESQPVNVVTGVHEYAGPDFNVYPNPGDGNFTLQLDQLSGAKNPVMNITDISGRLILSAVVYSQRSAIDLSFLSKGLYYLTLETEQGRSVKPVEINK